MHVLSTPPAFVLSQDQTLRECLPAIGCTHHESGTTTGIRRSFTASSLCFVSKEPRPSDTRPDRRGINISGVDFWHAVEFSRNGRFLRTHPLGLSSGRFPSVFPTLSDPFGPDSLSAGPFDIHYVSRFPRQLIIEFRAFEFRHADMQNSPSLRVIVSSGLAASGCWRSPYPVQAARATLRTFQGGVNFGGAWGRGPDKGSPSGRWRPRSATAARLRRRPLRCVDR